MHLFLLLLHLNPLFADCEGACPDGCSTDASRCGICTGNANITGVVKLCNIQTPLGNVEVYSGRNRLLKLTETGPDGRFQLPLMCADKLDLYFQKYGHTSVKPFYKVSQGLSVTVSMCANRKYVIIACAQLIKL